jgi:hypothetical protein
MILDLEPDLIGYSEVGLYPGTVWDMLETRHLRWGGGGLPEDVGIEFVEGEYMKEEEYDLFILDPSDFIMRYYLPRVFGALGPFSNLPAFINLTSTGFAANADLFSKPEYKDLARTLYRAGKEREKSKKLAAAFTNEMVQLGFPVQMQSGSTPLDGTLSFTLITTPIES